MAFNAALAAYFVLVLNLPLARELVRIFGAMPHFSVPFAISVPLLFWAAFQLIFALLLFRWTAKPLAIFLVLVGAGVSYASFAYRVVFDLEMVRNFVETDTGEASSYLSLPLAAWIGLLGIVPAIVIARIRIARPPLLKAICARGAVMAGCLMAFLVTGALYYENYAAVARNNHTLKRLIVPTDVLYGAWKLARKTWFTPVHPFVHIAADARSGAAPAAARRPRVLVIAVGETARAQNQRYYGYARDTNPHTGGLGMVRFADTSSCGTATAVSVPCMFSDLTRATFDREAAYRRDNLLDFLTRAGSRVVWIDNDHGCKGVCDRVETQIVAAGKTPGCDGDPCLDATMADLSPYLPQPDGPDTVIVLHLSGSHGPTYWKRYPPAMRRFAPDCPRADIQNCSHEALVNTYDNTIAYTDYVLARTIASLQARPDLATALVYMSDHGESLGERGIYLHGWPYMIAPPEQTTVPFLAWLSPGFRQQTGIDAACLAHRAGAGSYSHDNLFHTVLGLMAVRTAAYSRAADVFAPCRIPPLSRVAALP